MTIYRGAMLASFGLAAAGLAGCSGGNASTGTPGQPNASEPTCTACDGGDTTAAQFGTNPDGIPYPIPAGGYGGNARAGTTSGSVMRNFKFSGYPNAVVAAQLQIVSMADYYDPCSQRYKLIHLTVGALWCTPCNQETDALVAAKQQLDAEGVVILQAIDDGASLNKGATQADLNTWISKHHTTFTEVLDPDPNPVLGAFFKAAAVPWNCDIDPRTMEILDSSVGWGGDIASDLSPALADVQSPPQYALPAACNDL
jgi:hypothetical protein